MDEQRVSVRLVQPGQHDDVVARPEVAHRVADVLLERDPGVGSPLGALHRRVLATRERGLDAADGAEHVPGVGLHRGIVRSDATALCDSGRLSAAAQREQRAELADAEQPGGAEVAHRADTEPEADRQDLPDRRAAERGVETPPDGRGERRRDDGRDDDARQRRQRRGRLDAADAPPHQDRERDRAGQVGERHGERQAPDADPEERCEEDDVEREVAERDERRDPVRLEPVERPVEQQHPPVEDEPDGERGERAGDHRRLVRGELAALVDQARDRLCEHGRDEAGRDQQEADLADAGVDRPAEPGHVAARREPRHRREEDGGDGHREDPLREHVEAEGEVDRAGGEIRVDQARGEERADQRRDVDQPERQRHRKHEDEEAAHRRVAPVDRDPEPAVEPAEPRHGHQELDERRDHDRARVDVELGVLAAGSRDAEERGRG